EDLLPKGTSHELITAEIIQSKYLRSIWKDMTPPLRTEDIVKLSIGPEKSAKIGFKEFTDWEAILSEIIVGDAFGVDRIDYLLRDSYHAGVAYGRFDHYRLIDTLRILPLPLRDDPKQNKNYSNGNQIKAQSKEIMLGIEEGGLHSAESLLLARYFMFMQVYCHPVRRIYDIHLRDFLKEWLPEGTFSKSIPRHLNHTDAEIMVALRKACKSSKKSGYLHANRIINRLHFKVLYSRNPDDIQINPDSVTIIFEETYKKFGEENVRMDDYKQKGGAPVFPVLERDDRIVSSLDASHTLRNLPVVATGFVFIEREHYNDADKWLQENRRKILENYKTKEN
ncbi:MAG: HD domain-containing protein, partial [FCB group bacterium]|nr:HD domain-containing protein [FCB group bacterium]